MPVPLPAPLETPYETTFGYRSVDAASDWRSASLAKSPSGDADFRHAIALLAFHPDRLGLAAPGGSGGVAEAGIELHGRRSGVDRAHLHRGFGHLGGAQPRLPL